MKKVEKNEAPLGEMLGASKLRGTKVWGGPEFRRCTLEKMREEGRALEKKAKTGKLRWGYYLGQE